MTVKALARVRPHRLSSRRSQREFPGALHLQNGLVEVLMTGSSHARAVRAERSDPPGCVVFRDAARLMWTGPILRSPTAAQGKDNVNKADLVSHVVAETSTTKAAAERMVGAVFSAIAGALARDEPVAIAGFGKFVVRDRAARRGRNPRTGEPVAVPASKVPSFKPAKALRDAVNKQRDWAGSFILAIRFRNAAAARAYLRDADLQNLVSGITSAPNVLSVASNCTEVHPHSAGYRTLVAGRSRGNIFNSVECADLCAVHARTSDSSGPATPYYGETRIGSGDRSARERPSQVFKGLPRRLRPSSLAIWSAASFVQREVPSPTYRPAPQRRVFRYQGLARRSDPPPSEDSHVPDGWITRVRLRGSTSRPLGPNNPRGSPTREIRIN